VDALQLLRKWVSTGASETAGSLDVEEDGALLVDGWWPAGVRLDPSNFLVRVDDTCPVPGLPGQIVSVLEEAGFRHLEGDWAVVESIALQRLGLLGAHWQVWGHDHESARRAVALAVAGGDEIGF